MPVIIQLTYHTTDSDNLLLEDDEISVTVNYCCSWESVRLRNITVSGRYGMHYAKYSIIIRVTKCIKIPNDVFWTNTRTALENHTYYIQYLCLYMCAIHCRVDTTIICYSELAVHVTWFNVEFFRKFNFFFSPIEIKYINRKSKTTNTPLLL